VHAEFVVQYFVILMAKGQNCVEIQTELILVAVFCALEISVGIVLLVQQV